MKDITLETMIGQLVSIGFEGTSVTEEIKSIIREYKIGNYSIYAHNCRSKEQMRQLNMDMSQLISEETGIMPFISADQEGGMVTRLNDNDFTHFPGAMAVSASGNEVNAYLAGLFIAKEMRGVGFNMDFAPVVDINSNPNNPVIGVRAYGDDPQTVYTYARNMAKGLMEGGVIPVFKHFPGHGDTSQDSHFSLPVIEKSFDELLETELVPYIRAINEKCCKAIMTSHIIFTKIEPEHKPATMSYFFLTELLRERLGFTGIIKTDDLLMEAIKNNYGIVEGAVDALRAGADIMSISRDPAAAIRFVTKVKDMVKSKEIPYSMIEKHYERILCEKKTLPDKIFERNEYDCIGSPEHKNIAQRINDESVTLYEKRDSLIPDGRVLVIGTNAFNQTNIKNPLLLELNAPELISSALNCDGITINVNPSNQDIDNIVLKSEQYDSIVFCSYNANIFTNQVKLARQLDKLQKKLYFIALRNPYDLSILPGGNTKIATYEYTPHSIQTIIKVLKGNLSPKGKPCIKI